MISRSAKKPLSLRDRALRFLAQRERSRLELRRKLLTRSADALEVDALLDEFAQAGWLSDERFADLRVRARAGTVSRRYMVEELKQHGIGSEASGAAMGALEQDDYETALALWRRKFGAPPTDQKEKARQVRFLQSRGFSLSLVLRLLRAQGVASDEE